MLTVAGSVSGQSLEPRAHEFCAIPKTEQFSWHQSARMGVGGNGGQVDGPPIELATQGGREETREQLGDARGKAHVDVCLEFVTVV